MTSCLEEASEKMEAGEEDSLCCQVPPLEPIMLKSGTIWDAGDCSHLQFQTNG